MRGRSEEFAMVMASFRSLWRGNQPPAEEVRYWPTPEGAGVFWSEMLPGRCRRCLLPIRYWARGWWEEVRTRHFQCDERDIMDLPRINTVRRPVTDAQRADERRTLCERLQLTQDQWEALTPRERRRHVWALRMDRTYEDIAAAVRAEIAAGAR